MRPFMEGAYTNKVFDMQDVKVVILVIMEGAYTSLITLFTFCCCNPCYNGGYIHPKVRK